MRIRFLLLTPVLVSIAGCSEKIEAQENSPEASAIEMPPEQKDEGVEPSEDQEANVKLRSPVVLD